ncbi:MAG: hypothetical protein J5647_01115 [Spirochaetaceae bacterium]|nr:hypothetical protein [Spirochaetaceae bacterium]
MEDKKKFKKGLLIWIIAAAVVIVVGVVVLLVFNNTGKPVLPPKTVPVAYAGVRCSTYGIDPFPSVSEWDKYAEHMQSGFEGSSGSYVWIVGYVEGNGVKKQCVLNFPIDTKIEYVTDFPMDMNEEFLTMADEKGYSVWLQVEPGDADIVELAGAVMRHYKNHKSVKGFGIDVEWYHPWGTDGYGVPLTDEIAEQIDKKIKKIDKRFNYFVKHWDEEWLPPTYRSDMIFVNDSQGHRSLQSMKHEFDSWAEHFAPNPVMYQIGYPADKRIWSTFDKPEYELGEYLAKGAGENQNVGIIWVDFSLREVVKLGE